MTATAQAPAATCPYPGLRSFTEADAELFFGRSQERDVIVAHLRSSRLTVLYGPSGTGKTSLLRAGVMVALRELAEANLERVGTPDVVPVAFSAWRDDPVRRLGRDIATAVKELTGRAVPPSPSLPATIAAAARAADATILLILDQFEELALYEGASNGAVPFSALLPELVNDRALPVGVLLSIRDDALSQLDAFRKAIPGLMDSRLAVSPLSAEGAREAIVGPLLRYNETREEAGWMEIEDELVTAVLHQVRTGRVRFDADADTDTEVAHNGHQPTTIDTPYLQLVMETVWQSEVAAGSHVLRRSTLRGLGEAQGIVSHHLDHVLRDLTADQRELAVDVFNHLVTPSGTKIAMRVPDLAEYSRRDVEEVGELVAGLEGQRILRPVSGPLGGKGPGSVEIFHDVLAPGILAWRRRQSAERLRREKHEAERRARIFLAVAVAAVTMLVFAIGAIIYAEIKRSQADHARRVAVSGQVALRALSDLQRGSLDTGALLSLAAYAVAPTEQARDDLVLAQEHTAGMLAYLTGNAGQIAGVALSPDRRMVAAATADGQVLLWDAASGRLVRRLTGHPSFVQSVAFSPDGSLLASVGSDGRLIVWQTTSGRVGLDAGGSGALYGVAISADGRRVASAGAAGVIVVRDLATGRVAASLRTHVGTVNGLAFSATGETLAAAGSSGAIAVWDLASGPARVLRGRSGSVNAVAFDPRGAILAAGSDGGQVTLWNLATGRALGAGRAPAAVETVAFSPDGRTLASGGKDDSVSLWTLPTLTLARTLHGQSDVVSSVAFASDGRVIASGSYDGSVVLWNTAPSAPTALVAGSPVETIAFAPGGARLAAGTAAGAVVVWNGRSVRPAFYLLGNIGLVQGVAFSPDGRLVAAAGQSGTLEAWDVASGRPRYEARGNAALHALAFSPDGRLVAAADQAGAVEVFDAATGALRYVLRASANPLFAVAFSPDGTLLAAAGADPGILVWDLRRRAVVHVLRGHTELVEGLAFSPDGRYLASASDDRSIILWNPGTGQAVGDPLRGHLGGATAVAFDRSGSLLASGSFDTTAVVWNVHTRLAQPLAAHAATVTSVAFDPAGSLLATGSQDGTIALYPSPPQSADISAIRGRLCGVVRRDLTAAEWREFVPGEPYQRLCGSSR